MMRVNARLRSISLTSAWIPIVRHCWRIISAICVNCKNCPPTVIISMRNRPLPSVRKR